MAVLAFLWIAELSRDWKVLGSIPAAKNLFHVNLKRKNKEEKINLTPQLPGVISEVIDHKH